MAHSILMLLFTYLKQYMNGILSLSLAQIDNKAQTDLSAIKMLLQHWPFHSQQVNLLFANFFLPKMAISASIKINKKRFEMLV